MVNALSYGDVSVCKLVSVRSKASAQQVSNDQSLGRLALSTFSEMR